MNWDALGAVAELLGAIAVFLTLAYLTFKCGKTQKPWSSKINFLQHKLCRRVPTR